MPNPILTEAVDALASGRSLSQHAAARVLREIMAGDCGEVEIAGFLVALRTKGETEEELAGLASTMRELATPVRCERPDLLDTSGTVSPFARSATRKAPVCTSVERPSMISASTAAA